MDVPMIWRYGGWVMRCRLLALTLFAASFVGCAFPPAGDLPPPVTAADADSAKARFPDSSESSLNAGHDLFASRCNGCHRYPDIAKIDDARWPEILSRMGKKANLDNAQTHSVLSFVLVARSHSEATPPSPAPTREAAPGGW
jgi:mono/diheme cytochrome c family protein